MLIEKQSDLLAESVANCMVDPQKALEDAFGDEYCELAQAIVEPKGIDDEYYTFMEVDPYNWMGFVLTVIGSKYKDFVQHIIDNGY
jgi:hypothetical protein